MLTVLDNPLVRRDITILRDAATPPAAFRAAMQRIGVALAVESAKYLSMRTFRVQTPLEETEGYAIGHDIILLPVLRAGVSLVEAFSMQMPEARIGYIGLRRNEETLQTEEYYCNIPKPAPDSLVFVLDPMLATGGSVCSTVERLERLGASRIVVVSVIAAPEGVKKIETQFPNLPILASTLDQRLNAHGFIVPGLGDAGDRYHGTV
jgi:uracil phosphoribosyltransferase